MGDLVLLKDVPDPAAEPVELNNAGRRNPFQASFMFSKTDPVSNAAGLYLQRKKVKILTQKDIDSGEHTINDVVYPLPGYSIDYPQNEIGELYQQLLGKPEAHKAKEIRKLFF